LNLLSEAISLHQKGDLAKAARLYRRILKATPRESNALKFLGLIELQSGNLAQAENLLAASIESNPNSPDCQYYLGRLCLQKEAPDRAKHHFESVIRLEPSHVEALTCLGILHRDRRDLSLALDYFQRAILANSRALEPLLGKGGCLIDLERPGEALAIYDRVLSITQKVAEAWHGRGSALRGLKRYQEAIAALERALAIEPGFVQAFLTRGNVFYDMRRHEDALAAYDKALAIKPDLAEAWVARGNVFMRLKHYREADAEYAKALAIKTGFPQAWAGRGSALGALDRHDEALAAYDRALSISPDFAEAWSGRGISLNGLRRHDEALAAYDKALAIRPDSAEAWLGRGIALNGLRRFDEALAAFDKALAGNAEMAEAWCGCGIALEGLRRHNEALAAYDKALAFEPDVAGVDRNRGVLFYNRALLFVRNGRHDEALNSFRRALEADPDAKFVPGHLVHARMQLCDWQGLREDLDALTAQVRAGKCVCEPFALLSTPAGPADQLRCSQIYLSNHAPTLSSSAWQGGGYRHDRIRVAYVSADFREHPVSLLMADLFERHDRASFETFAISLSPDEPSEMRKRLKRAFDHFIDASSRGDQDVAGSLREMEIDIAVDLMGHTRDARPNIFAFRAAPIQASYLGYPGTVGADFMDYVIADKLVLPFDQQPHYGEKIVHLPDCYLANDAGKPISPQVPLRAQEGLPETGFVFCCFNNSYKLSPVVFDVWMRLLARVAGSVLWLSQVNEHAVRNLRSEAEARGIEPERVVFAKRVPSLADHLARQQLADLFVDTLPYGAHATASDALWGGLPVLTCTGDTYAGRAATSLLHAIGLPELVTGNLQDYEALALELASDRDRLQSIRRKLAANRLTYPLFDSDRFRRHIEAAYRTMWERWQRGESPESFAVETELAP
jgi:predicted O-linked N-acetylglucosamine transferase (SPINDLY family)